MDTLILTNTGSVPLYVEDLGIEVLIGDDFDILQNFTAEDIVESFDFPSVYAQSGEIILDDGVQTYNMSLQDVLDYLTPLTKWSKLDYAYISGKDDVADITGAELEELSDGSDTILHIHDNRYYTEVELQTPGGATIHYNNIIGMPSGNTKIYNGDMYFQDPDRGNKWLSIAEEKYVWTEHKVDGKYMKIGHAGNHSTGYLIPQDFTITKIAVMTTDHHHHSHPTKELQIRVNSSSVHTFNLVAGQYISTTLDIDIYGSDILQMFVSGAGHHIEDAVVTLFGKWRTV